MNNKEFEKFLEENDETILEIVNTMDMDDTIRDWLNEQDTEEV